MLTKKQLTKKYNKTLYIKSAWYDEQKHACLICLEPAKPAKTCLKCNMMVCTRCASQWLKVNNRCPKKCSQNNWQLKNEPTLQFQYSCPYGCETILDDSTFEDHLLTCLHCPYDLKNLMTTQQLKLQYLCEQGHSLAFIGSEGFNSAPRLCSGCEKLKVIRAICRTCNTVYCSQCRPPLGLTNLHCPEGHKLLYEEKQLAYITCDHCSKKVLKSGQKHCFIDPVCNYAVCTTCYGQLPIEEQERD